MRLFQICACWFLVCCLLTTRLPADEGHHHEAGNPEQLGTVSFATSCSPEAQKSFQSAVAMLHSFWYEESEKAFAEAARTDAGCAMGYWGVAMSLYHPLWYPPDAASLKKGQEAIEKAGAAGAKTQRERDYIAALAVFYADPEKQDHETRAAAYEKAMRQLYQRYPKDNEAAIFYALALRATAAPTDKTYAHQKQAGAILEKIFALEPNHPGVAHYIIHCYDYPELASLGLPAARAYAKIAPSAPHALHMPSHIFTRLGLWQESIESNRASAQAAKDYAAREHMQGAWSQQLHAMDYLEYAYLQSGRDAEAKAVLDELRALQTASGKDLTAGYSIAAIPARYTLELGRWSEAASLDPNTVTAPVALALIYHARALGSAHSGNLEAGRQDVKKLEQIHDSLLKAKETYWAGQVEIQRREAAGWLAYAEGKKDEAVSLLRAATELEDSTDKHPVTPGAVVPARELLGQLLLAMNRPAEALPEFEKALQSSPNRFNALYGAARAAELAGNRDKAREYYATLLKVAQPSSLRPELKSAKSYLAELARK